MQRTYKFTLERINGQVRVTDYRESGRFIANTPLGEEPKEIIDGCKRLKNNLGLGKIRFEITIGEK